MYNRSKQVFLSITYLLLPGGPDPRQALPNFLLHLLSPLLVRRPMGIGASRPRLQDDIASAQPAAVQPLHQSQEDPLPRVPRQQPVNQPAARPHDLARHLDQRRAEGRELHPQQRSSLRLVLRRVSWRNRRQSGRSRPSGSRPGWPSPCTPSCSPDCPPASSAPAPRS